MEPKSDNSAQNQPPKNTSKSPTPPPGGQHSQSPQSPQPPQPPQPPPGAYPPGGYPQQGPYPQWGYPPAGAYPPGAYPPGSYPQASYPSAGGYQDAGYPPAGAYPPGGYPPYPPQGYPPGTPQQAYPPQQPEDTTPANFQLGTKLPAKLKVTCPKNTLKFDEEYFIRLLAGSISLSKEEKKKIVESIPKLKQAQIDELIRIFEEEKQKFAALSKKHVPQLEKLAQQHFEEWMDLEQEWNQSQKKQEDTSKADEIRKKLGI